MKNRSRLHGWRSIISFAIMAPAGVVAAFSPVHYTVDSWQQFGLRSVGWILFLAGAGMRWWPALYVGGRKCTELVTEGPYSITRNPIYVGTFLLTLSVGVMSQSLTFLLAFLLASVVYFVPTVAQEAVALRARHGEEFDAYCGQVPAFFPRFRLFRSAESVNVYVSGLWTEFGRMCRWAWIPVLCDLLVYLRAQPWWPIWFEFP